VLIFVSLFFVNFTSFLTFALLAVAGSTMIYATKSRMLSNIAWISFVYLYWIAQNFIAAYALFQIILRRPRK